LLQAEAEALLKKLFFAKRDFGIATEKIHS
jgi:hypothetical protein